MPFDALALAGAAQAGDVLWEALDALGARDVNAHRFVLSRRVAPVAVDSLDAAKAVARARRA
jgi:hypothetical protein